MPLDLTNPAWTGDHPIAGRSGGEPRAAGPTALAGRPGSPRPAGRAALAVAGALFAGLLAAPGCARRTGPSVPAEDVVVVGRTSAAMNLDPRVGTDAASEEAADLLYDGLLAKRPDGDLVPALAERWEVLDGGLRYRFRLREGVVFHDGRRLTSADVAWTFRSIADGTVATAKRAAFAQLAHAEAVDGRTVDLHLSEPYASFPVELTLGIVPEGTMPDEIGRRPVGTGPFRFVSRSPERLVLAAFDRCWSGRPRLDRVELAEIPDATVRALALLKGSVHLVVNDLPPDVVPRFRADPAFRVVEGPSGDYAYLGFNLRDPVLSDVRVRRAVALAIDRERLVATLWRGLGEVTETMMPPGHWARDESLEPRPHDPAAARRLLDAAGYPDPDGPGPRPRLRLELKTSTSETYALQAQVIQAMLAEVGIELAVVTREFATFYEDVKRGSFQMFTLLRTSIVDPNIYQLTLHSASVPPAGQNRGFWSNPRFDRLIDRANLVTDRAARRPLYVEAQRIAARELPYVSLFFKRNVAVMPAELRGFETYVSGSLRSVPELWWDRGEAPPRRARRLRDGRGL